MTLIQREVTVLLSAYMLAGVPVGGVALAGRMSPLYRLPTGELCRWWSRFALVVVAVFAVLKAASLVR
jgi:hypothetical protein